MTEAEGRFHRAMENDSARKMLAEFLRERYENTVDKLVTCNKDTFEIQKGKALELKELLTLITTPKTAQGSVK